MARATLVCIALSLLAFASAKGDEPVTEQLALEFRELTVPQEKLPADCHLRKVDRVESAFLPADTNPWITTDKASIAFIRVFIDPPVTRERMPQDEAQHKRWFEERAKGVEAAYVAIYEEPGAPEIGVYAVKYAVPIGDLQRRSLNKNSVLLTDKIAAVVWSDGDSKKGYNAVLSYLREIAKGHNEED